MQNPFTGDSVRHSVVSPMAPDRFWAIIENTRQKNEDNDVALPDALANELRPLTPAEIESFSHQFKYYHAMAYHWDLWGVIYIAHGGCGDDSFIDFRNWLISRGRDAYENALKDTDSLADEPGLADGFSESFGYVPSRVYKEKTGKALPLPPPLPERIAKLKGIEFSENPEELRQRFPKTWERYGSDG